MIAHNVGTASVLCCLDQSANMISAGLLHNVYGNGIFGFSDDSIESKRKFISTRLNNEAEEYLFQFYKLNYSYKNNWRRNYLKKPDSSLLKDKNLKNSLIIILADQYDHLINRGILWRDEAHDRLEFLRDNNTNLVRMAEIVVNPEFGSKLEILIKNALSLERGFIEIKTGKQIKYRIPKSYRKKLGYIAEEKNKIIKKKIQGYWKKCRHSPRKLLKHFK